LSRDGKRADDGGGRDAQLLALLGGGGFVSGERIAGELGISRAAVGKRVAELRKRGFAIAAVPRVGYRLDAAPDALSADVVVPRLTTRWLGRSWRHVDDCASTNDEAASWARSGAVAGSVVVADEQSRGRGRLGRRWHSPPGANLYFSTVLRPPLPPHRIAPITLAAGVAVAETIAAFDLAPALKWPNDVLLGGKKVAGILTEMSGDVDRVHHVVVGIGINVNVAAFPDELAAIATSLAIACGKTLARADVAAVLCARLEAWHDAFLDGGAAAVAAGWRRFAAFLGSRVHVTSGRDKLHGVAEDLDDDGALRLRLDDGRVTRVIAGEIT
jgi:BirA family transcriptional regulator, biotin operon repressor / biotin---[acetyl-CoA-carboxylase] ligase